MGEVSLPEVNIKKSFQFFFITKSFRKDRHYCFLDGFDGEDAYLDFLSSIR